MTLLTITALDSEPLLSEFVPLDEYRSSTPATFSLEESPVLYFSSDNLTLESKAIHRISGSNIPTKDELEILRKKFEAGVSVNVKVASSRLFLWFPHDNFGYSIPYTSITLHGITRVDYMYLQLCVPEGLLDLSDSGDVKSGIGGEAEFLELFIHTNGASQVHQFYKALNECSNLHADIEMSDEDDEQSKGFMSLMMNAMSGNLEGQSGPASADDDDFDMEIEIPLAEQISNDPRSYFYGDDNDGVMVSNQGDADDLEFDDVSESSPEETEKNGNAGLQIKLAQENPVKAGVRRRRDDNDEDTDNISTTKQEEENGGKWRRVA